MRLEKTVDLLIKAYLKGQLQHGNACSCAVGNICNGNKSWTTVASVDHYQYLPKNHWGYEQGKDVIRDSEYSLNELLQIEQSFEGRLNIGFGTKAALNNSNDPDGWIGLNQVFETLYQLEEDVHTLAAEVDIIADAQRSS